MPATPGTTAPVSEDIGTSLAAWLGWLVPISSRVSGGSPAPAGNGWRHPAKDPRWTWQRGSDAGHCQAGAGACSPWLHPPETPPDLRQEMRLRTGMQTSRSCSLADGAALDPHFGLTLGLRRFGQEREEEEEEKDAHHPGEPEPHITLAKPGLILGAVFPLG